MGDQELMRSEAWNTAATGRWSLGFSPFGKPLAEAAASSCAAESQTASLSRCDYLGFGDKPLHDLLVNSEICTWTLPFQMLLDRPLASFVKVQQKPKPEALL